MVCLLENITHVWLVKVNLIAYAGYRAAYQSYNKESVLRIIISYLLIYLGSNELKQEMEQVCKLFRDLSPYNKLVRTAGADALKTVKYFLLTRSWGAKWTWLDMIYTISIIYSIT